MAPLAFYDALAASASVFIGILTALLISNLSTMTTARGRIARRITAIDARCENLNHIEEVWETREQQDIKERVEDFIDQHVGSDFIAPIEHINHGYLLEKLANYLECEVEDLNQYHEDSLQNRMAEIETELVDAVVEAISSDYDRSRLGRFLMHDWS